MAATEQMLGICSDKAGHEKQTCCSNDNDAMSVEKRPRVVATCPVGANGLNRLSPLMLNCLQGPGILFYLLTYPRHLKESLAHSKLSVNVC